MEIKITFSFDKQTNDTLLKLVDALQKNGGFTIAAKQELDPEKPLRSDATEPPAEDDEWTQEEIDEVRAQIAAEEAGNAPTTPKTDADGKPLTIEDIRALAADVKAKKDAAAVRAVLAKFGATKVSELPKNKYGEVAATLRGML